MSESNTEIAKIPVPQSSDKDTSSHDEDKRSAQVRHQKLQKLADKFGEKGGDIPKSPEQETEEAEPISIETVEELMSIMSKEPQMEKNSSYAIPWRISRTLVDGVLDEQTGLFIEAGYNTDNSASDHKLRSGRPPGISIVVSTEDLTEENYSENLDNMVPFLNEIYGDNEDLEEDMHSDTEDLEEGMPRLRNHVKWLKKDDKDTPKRIKFELTYDEGGLVMSNYRTVPGKEHINGCLSNYITSKSIGIWGTSFKRYS